MSTRTTRTDMSCNTQISLRRPVPRRACATTTRSGSSANVQKPLIVRCGSASAPDPLATRSIRPPRSTTSKLTIVRLPYPQEAEGASEKKLHRRKTVACTSGLHCESPSRISFASATFSLPSSRKGSANDDRSPEPETSNTSCFMTASPLPRRHARTFSVGPHSSTRYPRPFMQGQFERLVPAQIYELAKTSSRPSRNVLPTGHSPSSLFSQLPQDVFLPFLDRASEVLKLLSNPANRKIMALFARILPTSTEYYPRTSAELAATVGSWSFEDFTTWLTQVSREEIDDEDWVRALRLFVLPKSEMLWGHLKGMLGVPPELDVDIEDEVSEMQPRMRKTFDVKIVPIHPTQYASGLRLDNISENQQEPVANLANEVVGLRICTLPCVLPPGPSAVNRVAKTVPSSPRTRTPVHGYAPLVSSPLAPKPAAQQRPHSAPPQKGTSVASSALSGLLSKIRSKDSACPMFPSSFDKVGMGPTLLHIA